MPYVAFRPDWEFINLPLDVMTQLNLVTKSQTKIHLSEIGDGVIRAKI